MKMISLIGFVVLLLGLYSAFLLHSTIWYSFFVVGGFLLLDGINVKNGFSILHHKKQFLFVWFVFILIGLSVEVIGNWWLNKWDYPDYDKFNFLIHVTLVGYPFVGFFGLELFVFLQNVFKFKYSKTLLPIVAFLFGYANEYPNLFAYEWKYDNWPFRWFLGTPILVSMLWIGLLLVLYFKRFFIQNSAQTSYSNPQNRF